jgi:hypothetical protein
LEAEIQSMLLEDAGTLAKLGRGRIPVPTQADGNLQGILCCSFAIH